MNKMFAKSQVALEFLMTYGWAILVVLVAIGALAYFGVLSPDRFLPSKCTLPAGIACIDHKVDSAVPEVQVVLRNGMGFDATSVTVSIGGCGIASPVGDNRLINGEREVYTATCPVGFLTSGSKFNQEFGIVYTNADTLLSHTANGSIVSRIE